MPRTQRAPGGLPPGRDNAVCPLPRHPLSAEYADREPELIPTSIRPDRNKTEQVIIGFSSIPWKNIERRAQALGRHLIPWIRWRSNVPDRDNRGLRPGTTRTVRKEQASKRRKASTAKPRPATDASSHESAARDQAALLSSADFDITMAGAPRRFRLSAPFDPHGCKRGLW